MATIKIDPPDRPRTWPAPTVAESGRSNCLFCGFPVERDDRFCQECGAHQVPYISSAQPSVFAKWWSRLANDRRLRLIIAGALSGMLSVIAITAMLSTSDRSKRTDSAAEALTNNRLNEAIYALEQLSLESNLSSHQQGLLDKAYFQRALVYLSNGYPEAARKDLLRITAGFIQYNEVLATAARIQGLAPEAGASSKKGSRQRLSAFNAATGRKVERSHTAGLPGPPQQGLPITAGRSLVPPPPPTEGASNAVTSSSVNLPQQKAPLAAANRDAAVSDSAVLQQGKRIDRTASLGSSLFVPGSPAESGSFKSGAMDESAPDAQQERDGAKLAARRADPGSDEKVSTSSKSRPKMGAAETDVVRYNRLLARYFGAGQAHTGDSVQRSVSSDMKEPPSFREWMDMGRPDF